jgi:hypothetical protein
MSKAVTMPKLLLPPREGVGKVRVGSGVCVDDFAGGEYGLEKGWKWGWERIRRGNIP